MNDNGAESVTITEVNGLVIRFDRFRFRYAHAKDRLQRRLFNAAKKALARIPTRSVRLGDKELDADCPVCIDPYRTGDIVRALPCRHVFHKTCVDPWLLEHRTCPMCKSDILKVRFCTASLIKILSASMIPTKVDIRKQKLTLDQRCDQSLRV
ncbi:unnamed protein product [Anisakis simplex]|uniref:Protein goliath (inferred by orthology to a D. melanogaster protein) n=1 Tax=Anisakis simplex TaxID=6269 RepID=A0A0M3J117_ANISI|nr:unnamed protein product [Anisakis simplex]